MRTAITCVVIVLIAAFGRADEPRPFVRPITEAQAVIAVYHEDWGLGSNGQPAIIFAAWPDGHMVWSDDRIHGGPPYHTAQIDPQKFAKLIARFENDGLFADGKLNNAQWGPDSAFIRVLIKSGKRKIQMESGMNYLRRRVDWSRVLEFCCQKSVLASKSSVKNRPTTFSIGWFGAKRGRASPR
jgi:hypothetical protein